MATLALSGMSYGQVYINEVFFNPAGNPDTSKEYIEIRGTANASLENKYLVVLEGNNNADVGTINVVFNLSNYSLGSNGYLALRQGSSGYSVNPLATTVTSPNNTWQGLATFASAISNFLLESPSWTYMLIDAGAGPTPTVNSDLDATDDGLDVLPTGWSILDSISILDGNPQDRAYAKVVFYDKQNPLSEPNNGQPGLIEPDAIQVGFDFGANTEPEYFARLGESTGDNHASWIVADLTSTAPVGRINPNGSTISPVLDGTNMTQSLGGLNPVPEPGCAFLLLSSTVLVSLRRHRKR